MKDKKRTVDFENKDIADGFAPDDSYLIELESSIFESLDIEETIMTKEDGFSSNEKYLKNLEENILDKSIDANKDVPVKRLVISKPSRKIWMVATSVAAVIAFIIMAPNFRTEVSKDFAGLTAETEAWYIEQQAPFMSDHDLSLLLADEVYNIEIQDEALLQELEDYILNNELYINE